MKFLAILAITGLAAAAAVPTSQDTADVKRASASIIEQLQSTFDRDNPNGTPTSAGNPADLNGDGVINAFESGAQAA